MTEDFIPFEAKNDTFIQWLRQNDIQTHPAVKIVDLRHQARGRGIIATQSIPIDTELFSIPRSALLTPAALPAPIIASATSDDEPLDPWTGLLLALIHEQTHPNSRWQPYLDLLPTESDFDTPMFWSPAELAELQSSAVRSKIGREDAEDMFKTRILPVIRTHASAFGLSHLLEDQLAEEVIRRAHVAASTIMAYAFDVEPTGQRTVDEEGYVSDESDAELPKAMVPLADLLNADADRNNAKLFYEADGTLVMRAVKDIAAGEEVFNDYGALSRGELLRRYGYVTERYAQYDVVEIPVECFLASARTLCRVPEQGLREKLERIYGEDEIPDGVVMANEDLELFTVEKMYELFELFPIFQLESMLEGPNTQAGNTGPQDQELDTLLARHDGPARDIRLLFVFVLRALDSALSSYGTTYEQDAQKLEQLQQRNQPDQQTRRIAMAIAVRMGEKKLLKQVVKKLHNMWQEAAQIGAQSVQELLDSSKRQRKRRKQESS
ncbi:SET domain-containing protein [Microthyrium microscopicum]|uniref:Ribosomal lysine N-methyltransferase 4 n=1 Tax=Microthyrium microscopicum TaxID=703497 RepID=A0A6A6UG17_9PEZI|nr:SET domain-containing protein [Microthyrium microscopicum]